MKINLGFNSKRYSRDMSFDNNTTYGFGEIQPLLCQFLSPDSDIHISGKSLVRLSPLKFPSFARVRLELVSRFVPVTEVFSPFESLLSNIPFSNGSSTFVPSAVPSIISNFLMIPLLQRSYCTLYKVVPHDGVSTVLQFPSSTESNILRSLLGFPFILKSENSIIPVNHRVPTISIDGADFVFEFNDTSSEGSFYQLAFRLTPSGQRLRKIFVGLGYDCLTDNYSKPLIVSLVPLLAFYKAYFETYYPQRFVSFPNTNCFNLIQWLSALQDPVLSTALRLSDKALSLLFPFFDDLSNCFYASEDDYISIHTSTPLNASHSSNLPVVSDVTSAIVQSSTTSDLDNKGTTVPKFILGKSTSLDSFLLKSLTRFTNYVSKDSVIGQRMSQWVKQHFNADIANQLFKDSHFIGRTSIPLNISDVFSTSDTALGSGSSATGERLGAFAGKGIGFGNLEFNFHSQVHGYVFVFACIVPDSRTCQGVDPTLLSITRFSLPSPEFDALGYEVTDKRVFVPSNDISPLNQNSSSSQNYSFGFVPRYTGFKFKKNIANGDMSRRSTSTSMSPYFLDRLIDHNHISRSTFVSTETPIPSASPSWRFITRYGYLGNFNRIFYNDDDYNDFPFGDTLTSLSYVDNFLSQTIFNVRVTDFLKPLKSSYDTISADDNNVKPVTSE